MAVTGTDTYNQTTAQIITDALILITAQGAEDNLASSDYTFCLSMLNKLTKSLVGKGVGLWTRDEGILFLKPGQGRYVVGSSSSDRASNSWVVTTTSASAAISATSITVTSTSQDPTEGTDTMAISDHIGIVYSQSAEPFWTTITNIVGNVITLNNALPAAVSSGSAVYSYTTTITKPVRIESLRLRQGSSTTSWIDRPMISINKERYERIADKFTTSTPLQGFTDNGLASQDLYVYPVPSLSTDYIRFSYTRHMFDFTNATDSPDYPSEWLLTLTYLLAVYVAPAYGYKMTNDDKIYIFAKALLNNLIDFDIDDTNLGIIPSFVNDDDYEY